MRQLLRAVGEPLRPPAGPVKTPDALRAEIDEQLPCLDAARLTSTAMLRRAYVLLGQLVHGYCFASADAPGPAPPPTDGLLRVPPQLAKPWHQVCDRLGLPCVLTAIGVDAWNWQRIDPAKPIELGNITCLSTITGTRSEVILREWHTLCMARCGTLALNHSSHLRLPLTSPAMQSSHCTAYGIS